SIVARVTTGEGEGASCALARLSWAKDGLAEEWSVRVNATTGPFAATAPVASGGLAGLALADGANVTFLSLADRKPTASALEIGKIVAWRSTWPEDGAGPLLVLGEDDTLRSIVRTPAGARI